MNARFLIFISIFILPLDLFSQSVVEEEPWEVPEGWSYVAKVGPPEIFTLGASAEDPSRPVMKIHTHKNAGILAKNVSLAVSEDTAISWQWLIDTLPSAVAEDTASTHDYISVAVLFDNGQDLSYVWSSELPVDTGFRCPLERWAETETHVIVRNGRDDLKKWISEERNLLKDYRQYVGGEDPVRITQVWLISTTYFQQGVGEGKVANIVIEQNPNGSKRTKVL